MGAGDSPKAVRVRVRGRVQGVWYRGWAEGRARMLGVEGWVRNRSDGSVELLLVGLAETVDRMVADCASGPHTAMIERAEVTEAFAEDVAAVAGQGFEVRHSL